MSGIAKTGSVMGWNEKITTIWDDQAGATTVEYGMILSLVVLVVLVALANLAESTVDLWQNIQDSVIAATTGA
jgi:pilus assembly protein Flp/PilA